VRWAPTSTGGVWIEVEDQGVGIDPEDLGRIFDEFTQIAAHPGSGTGLGLPISLRLANLLGGSLEATSRVGDGSTFRLVLPQATPSEDHAS
jgi:signal transduction histidine kinase